MQILVPFNKMMTMMKKMMTITVAQRQIHVQHVESTDFRPAVR